MLAVGAILAALGGWLGATQLHLNADTNALIGNERPFMQRYRAFLAEFGDLESIVAVVDPRSNSESATRAAEAAVDALGPALQSLVQSGLLARVDWKITPNEQWTIASRAMDTTALRALAAQGVEERQSLFTAELPTQYLRNPNGKLLFIEIMPTKDFSQFGAIEKPLEAIRSILATVASAHPTVELGLTGKPVLLADEMATSNRDMFCASTGAFFIIALLFVITFRGVRLPLLAMLAFLCACAWTIGAAALLVGQITLLSSVFLLVLVGAGLDYGVHVVSRYREARQDRMRDQAITETLESIAPGTITGALTSAAVFYLALCTDFAGLRELGLIAGTGLLLCALAMVTVLPALLVLNDVASNSIKPLEGRALATPPQKPTRARFMTLSIVTVACIALAPIGLHFDANLLSLQSPSLDSVAWEKRVFADSASASWFAASTVTTEIDALALIERTRGEAAILRTRSVFDVVRPDSQERTELRADLAATASDGTESMRAFHSGATASLHDALPRVMQDKMVSAKGSLLVAHFPREDVWEEHALARFVDAVLRVDPDATGVPMTQLESIRDMRRAFVTVSLFSILAVALLAWLDFRRLTPTILATASVLVGVLMLLGLLPLCGLSLNLANFFAIPMLLGLGIDSAIHILHRWDAAPTHMRPTLRAVAFTATTTAIGFGALIFAQHRGLQSLGYAMLLGSLSCLFASNVLLPMLLATLPRQSSDSILGSTPSGNAARNSLP